MKLVAISDTHNRHNRLKIPPCDLLIHAGDWSFRGTWSEVTEFADWLEKQPAKHIVVIPGNHEKFFEEAMPYSLEWIKDRCPRAHLLIEESVTIEGINIYGSPITPFFHNWAWNRYIDEIKVHWDKIPEDTDILITHGPPANILDDLILGGNVGCYHLLDRVKEVEPDLHFFGHIHFAHGNKVVGKTHFYNVSCCDEDYVCNQGYTELEYTKEVKSE